MKLMIVSVHGHGNVQEEYVLLRALEDCDTGKFLLADTTYFDEYKVSNKVRHTFWLPDKEIKKGDYVSVWTKVGINTEATHNGRPIHRYFWNLKTAVWNDSGDCAVLMSVPEWQFFKVAEK